MRWLGLTVLALVGCGASRPPAPPLALPTAGPGVVEVTARALDVVGEVRPIEIAVSSERADALVLDRRQIYARTATLTGELGGRVASFAPGEAARRAAGEALPTAARSSAMGAAQGGLRGAATGAVTGGGTGGAIGAAVGAIGGAFRGSQAEPPDVAGFEDRGLPVTTLRPGVSAVGLVYFPAGDYAVLEVVLIGEGAVERKIVAIASPAP